MEKQKWFYPLQEEVKTYLKNRYKHFESISHTETENIFIETFHAVYKSDVSTVLQSVAKRTDNSVTLTTLVTF